METNRGQGDREGVCWDWTANRVAARIAGSVWAGGGGLGRGLWQRRGLPCKQCVRNRYSCRFCVGRRRRRSEAERDNGDEEGLCGPGEGPGLHMVWPRGLRLACRHMLLQQHALAGKPSAAPCRLRLTQLHPAITCRMLGAWHLNHCELDTWGVGPRV